MNPNSSRSHCIVHLELDIRNVGRFERQISTSITLADLAGSECLEKTKTKGKNTREGSMINKSLLALSNVISKLSRREDYVGFRESKLTRILQPALTGNVMVSVVCTINPYRSSLQESINTLKFGTCAGVIKKKLEWQPEKPSLDSKMAKEVLLELEDMGSKLTQVQDTLQEKEQTMELLQLTVEELKTTITLTENEKNYYAKENERLNVEVRALLSENSKLLNSLDELETRIIMQKEQEFKYMFDQQSLLIKSLEEEIDRLKSEREEDYKEAIKQREVIACMRKAGDNSVRSTKMEPSSSSFQPTESAGPERQGKTSQDFIDKLRLELDSVKVKLVTSQKEVIKYEKINRQMRLDNDALRKELEESMLLSNRPRKVIKPFLPLSVFDRNGDLIQKKVTQSPTKEDLKNSYKNLEKRNRQLERQRDQSLEREEHCRLLSLRLQRAKKTGQGQRLPARA